MKAKSERCLYPTLFLKLFFFFLFHSDLLFFGFSGPMSWATLGRNQSISQSMPANTSTSWHILCRSLCQAAYQVRILQLFSLFLVNYTYLSKVTCILWQKCQPRAIGPQLIWDCEVLLSELLWISFFSGRKNIFLYSWESFSCRKWLWEFISLAGEWPRL